MLFHSIKFIFGFLPITFLGFVLLHHAFGRRAALAWLCLASILFYAQWSIAHGLLLTGSIVVNFAFCRAMLAAGERQWLRRALLWSAIGTNLGVLGYLKYVNFLIDNINGLTGSDLTYVQVLVPVGVSFYTFIQIGFLVEVFNRQVRGVALLDYAVFGSFFAYVTAGPLVLQRDLMQQINDRTQQPLDSSRIAVAITVFGIGLFKKMALADSIGPVADTVFAGAAAGAEPSMSLAWVGALAYMLQLYFDFSGYSDMALGIGMLFGLRLPFNFNSPLKATSISDFWRRWHMTMTRFFTSYLYAPLAVANARRAALGRYSPLRRFLATTAVPVFYTFLLAGIWHGAGWTFVVFGVIHGIAMATEHGWRQARMPELPGAVGWLLTMLVVLVGLVVFRAPDLGTAWNILSAMAMGSGGKNWIAGNVAGVGYADAVGLITLLLAIALLLPNTQQILYHHAISSDPDDHEGLELSRWLQWQPSLRWAMASATVLIVAIGLATGGTSFLYYQF